MLHQHQQQHPRQHPRGPKIVQIKPTIKKHEIKADMIFTHFHDGHPHNRHHDLTEAVLNST